MKPHVRLFGWLVGRLVSRSVGLSLFLKGQVSYTYNAPIGALDLTNLNKQEGGL